MIFQIYANIWYIIHFPDFVQRHQLKNEVLKRARIHLLTPRAYAYLVSASPPSCWCGPWPPLHFLWSPQTRAQLYNAFWCLLKIPGIVKISHSKQIQQTTETSIKFSHCVKIFSVLWMQLKLELTSQPLSNKRLKQIACWMPI